MDAVDGKYVESKRLKYFNVNLILFTVDVAIDPQYSIMFMFLRRLRRLYTPIVILQLRLGHFTFLRLKFR